ncbi:MAG: type VI secretion system tip protein TssI/VgrG [Polyangiaceae bacterium]
MSKLFRFDLTVTSELGPDAFEPAVLGAEALLVLPTSGEPRGVRGVVSALRHEGRCVRAGGRAWQYRIRLEPRACLARRRYGSAIFRKRRVDEVIEATLARVGAPCRFLLRAEPLAREYTTQYEESDFGLVERLAAENGLLFYCEQPAALPPVALAAAAGMQALPNLAAEPVVSLLATLSAGALGPNEVLVFSDSAAYGSVSAAGRGSGLGQAAPPASSEVVLPFVGREGPGVGGDVLLSMERRRNVQPTQVVYREYDPARPLTPIEAAARVRSPAPLGSDGVSADLGLGELPFATDLEVYEHADPHAFPSWVHAPSDADKRLRAHRRDARTGRGVSTSVLLSAGHRFRVEDHPDAEMNRGWVATSVHHDMRATRADGLPAYRNTFQCVPSEIAFLPRRPPPRSIQVCLTAVVVGPANEEIHVNEAGEIKVHFHWDRRAPSEESTSWIRTAHPWAGAGWGSQFIPRVGMEVVVVFENGDPDRPLVMGSVYNAIAPPPFALPEDKTKSGIRTRSTPGGGGYNELSFEDRQGQERVFLRAERDLETFVVRDRRATVRGDDRQDIVGDSTSNVERDRVTRIARDREASVARNDRLRVDGGRSVSIGGSSSERVEGDRSVRIECRDRREVLDTSELLAHADCIARIRGGAAVLVGQPAHPQSCVVHVEGVTEVFGTSAVTFESQSEIVLRCGESTLRLGPAEIEIASPRVAVRGSDARLLLAGGEAKLRTKGKTQVVADQAIVLQSMMGASAKLGTEAALAGAQVLLNSPAQAKDEIEANEPRATVIELTDDKGEGLPFQRFTATLRDGSNYTGFLDAHGRANIHVEQGGEISFPDLGDVEKA